MGKAGKILIIDDNEDILFALNLLLEPYFEEVRVSSDPNRIEGFMERFRPDVILLDMNFTQDAISGREGFLWLERILQKDPKAVVVLMTAYSDTEKAVTAIKKGAVDFISKPWDKEKLLATLSAAFQLRKSREEVENLRQKISSLEKDVVYTEEIVGESKEICEMLAVVRKLSGADANILIIGENGTGKDLVARAIYQNSSRAGRIFTHLDLGSIAESLFESELFGYEKGAFTDAKKEKTGRLEAASGGTLFLDEIGNLSLPMQSKLLTAIEKKHITRLGSTRQTPIDVRFISATNSDIHQMAAEGLFRQDLLYRINTIEIVVPPLRERGDDVLLLGEHFLKRYAHKYKKNISGFSKELKNKLLQYPWPGNVRELQHAVERAAILSNNKTLQTEDFAFQQKNESRKGAATLNLERLEREAIQKSLQQAAGNLTKAAELLGITRFTLYRKMEKFGL